MWKYEIFKFQILTSSAAPRPCLLLRHPIPVIRIQKPLARHSVLKISGETTFPTFRSKIVLKCVAVRVLPKFENFRLSHIKPLCVALTSFKLSTFLTWYDCKQNVLKINTLSAYTQKLCRVTIIRPICRFERSGVAKLKRWTSCSAVQVVKHSTFWF